MISPMILTPIIYLIPGKQVFKEGQNYQNDIILNFIIKDFSSQNF